MSVSRSLLLMCLTLLAGACGLAHDADGPDLPCLHIRAATGQDYWLGYAAQKCGEPAYPPLPQYIYSEVAAWAFNARGAGFLAPIDQFRIVARMATLDERKSDGFSLRNVLSRTDEWSSWAKAADLIARNTLNDDALVNALIETPLSRAHLATGHGLNLKLRTTSLTPSVAMPLRAILSRAEARLQEIGPMLVAPRTLEQAVTVMEQPDDGAQLRASFTVYQIVRPN